MSTQNKNVYYFDCDHCGQQEKGALEVQVLNYVDSEVANLYRGENCGKTTLITSKMNPSIKVDDYPPPQ